MSWEQCENCKYARHTNATYFDPPEDWCSLDRDEVFDEEGEDCEAYSYWDEVMEYNADYDARLRGFEKG